MRKPTKAVQATAKIWGISLAEAMRRINEDNRRVATCPRCTGPDADFTLACPVCHR